MRVTSDIRVIAHKPAPRGYASETRPGRAIGLADHRLVDRLALGLVAVEQFRPAPRPQDRLSFQARFTASGCRYSSPAADRAVDMRGVAEQKRADRGETAPLLGGGSSETPPTSADR